MSRSWVYELLARYRAEGAAAFEPRSRRPRTSPRATPPRTVELVLALRKHLGEQGLDAGADTIGWHLAHHHDTTPVAGHDPPDPDPATPRSSRTRQAAPLVLHPLRGRPAQRVLAVRLHPLPARRRRRDADVEIITWLDDHSRYALHVSAHRRVTAAIVAATFGDAAAQHGFPASTLTDNGMVYTVRLASRPRRAHRPGTRTAPPRHRPEEQPTQPPHHLRQGRTLPADPQELAARPTRPPPRSPALQALLDAFVEIYNQQRPHRSLPHRATPATAYIARPKAAPGLDRDTDTHDRVRTDKIDKSGTVTLRVAGRLRHIGIGRPHAGTHVLLLVHDLHVRVIHAATGELLRELDIDPTRDYQPRHPPEPEITNARTHTTWVRASGMS